MQQNFYNAFCVVKDEQDFVKNVSNGVEKLDCLCEDPFFAVQMMKKYNLNGKIIVPMKFALDNAKLLKLKNSGFEISIFIDLLEDENILNAIAMTQIPTTLLLYENLNRTGEISQKYGGVMPAQVLEKFGFLDRECTIVGAMYADKDDLTILGDYDAKVVLCPRSFASKGGTFANLKLLQKYDLKLFLGTFDFNEIDFEKEKEFLKLTNCALHESKDAISDEFLNKISKGEQK